MNNLNNTSFYILHKLINFIQRNGFKTKIFSKLLIVFKYLTIKYSMALNILFYYIFIKWRPILELRTIKTKTRNYIIGVPVRSNRMYYILFKFYFKQLKLKQNKNFSKVLLNICTNILNNPNKLILNNHIIFNQVYKNRAYLHFRRFLNL